MHKRSLLFDVQQDGAAPVDDSPAGSAHARQLCRALVKCEPVPQWLILFQQVVVKK